MENELKHEPAGLKYIVPYEAPQGMSVDTMLELFYKMCLIRQFDTTVRQLWLDNKIYGLAHSYVGAEAVGVGACAAIRPDDYITSTHRGHGHTISKGADIKRMMAELMGKYEGYNHGKGGSMHIADIDHGMMGATGIVGSGMPLAIGAALSSKTLKNGKISVCFHGDGGSNQGVWHESINMAAAWKLPCIFMLENNGLAIATDVTKVTGEPDLYKRAAGYGIPGVQVDGFNVFEVYKAVSQAAERARSGQGPTLIEARFTRLLGHFVADDQWYRDLTEVEPLWAYEPITRMREYLIAAQGVSKDKTDEIEKKAVDEVAGAVAYAENECTQPPLNAIYDDLYANGEMIL